MTAAATAPTPTEVPTVSEAGRDLAVFTADYADELPPAPRPLATTAPSSFTHAWIAVLTVLLVAEQLVLRAREVSRSFAARVGDAARMLRRALVWSTDLPGRGGTRRWRRRVAYRGRHHVERRFFGRARSTAEQTAAYHRNYREGADLLEVDLPVPVYWIGWAQRLAEVLRRDDEPLYPTTSHRFVCS